MVEVAAPWDFEALDRAFANAGIDVDSAQIASKAVSDVVGGGVAIAFAMVAFSFMAWGKVVEAAFNGW